MVDGKKQNWPCQTHTHARTHARTHAHMHMRTDMDIRLEIVILKHSVMQPCTHIQLTVSGIGTHTDAHHRIDTQHIHTDVFT